MANNHEIYFISMMHGGVKYFSRHYDFCTMEDESIYELMYDGTWECIISSPNGLSF